MTDGRDNSTSSRDTGFQATVSRKTARKREARRRGGRGVLFWVGMFGLVGWSVALPTLLGGLLGRWLDEHWPSSFSWTLTLLLVGLVIGCATAIYWVRQESNRHDERQP